MTPSFASSWAGLVRQGRLVGRHIRYPIFTEAGRRARSAALETLFLGVNGWLHATGIEYCLVYGTLLGWQREGRILEHDSDVDFGTPVAGYSRLVEARDNLPTGFKLHDTSRRHNGPKLYISYRGWEADIYFFTEEKGMLRVILSSDLPGDRAPFSRDLFFPRQPATFLGAPTFVPAQASAYLEHLYRYTGPNAELDPETSYYRPRSPR